METILTVFRVLLIGNVLVAFLLALWLLVKWATYGMPGTSTTFTRERPTSDPPTSRVTVMPNERG